MTTVTDKKLMRYDSKTNFLRFWLGGFLKRAFDILVSLLGLILLLPFFAYVAMLLRREGQGPIFYRGLRAGRGGKPFQILKFRTMYERPESYKGPLITAKGDKRITPLGSWLRESKLNELPQLWNVLIGDMSMVGPRPEDVGITKDWPADARDEILSVRPGITSPASVLYRDEESLLPADGVMDVYFREILPDKLRLDRLYVRNHSLLGDLDILFWTAMAVVPHVARHHIPESKLFAGPLYRFVQRHVSWFFRDLVIYLVVVGLTGLVWRMFGPIHWGIGPLSVLAFALALLFSSVNAFLGLDRIIWSRAGAEEGMILVASNGITVLILLVASHLHRINLWFSLPALPTELIVMFAVFTMIGSLFARYRMRLVTAFAGRWLSWRTGRGGLGERVLILGAGDGGQIVNWLLRRGSLRKAFSVVGMVDDDPAKQGMRIDGCTVLGGGRDIPDLVQKHDVGVLLYTINNISPEARRNLLRVCEIPDVRMVYLNDILTMIQSRLTGQKNEVA